MRWLWKRERLFLIVILLAGACLTGLALYSSDHYVFVYSGDASSHLVRTRQFVDSQQTGIHNVGTAWLPLPHLLLLPFAANDFLFYNGLAAIIPGIACLIGAALALYGVIRRITGSRSIGLVGALVIGLNPNILYLSLIPMSEATLLLFLSAAAYCLLRWLEQPGALRWLGFCSATLCCATLSRYETWPLPGALVLISIYLLLTRQIPGGWGKRAAVLLLSAASSLGALAWLLWNFTEYGDPVQFAKAIYDIGPSDSRAGLAGHPVTVLSLYGKTVLYMFGPVLLGLGLAAIGGKRRNRKLLLLYGFLLLPPLFTLVSLERGFAQMDEWWWNSRYVLPLGIPLLIAGSTVLHHLWSRSAGRTGKLAMTAALLSFSLVQVAVPSVGVITFIDAAKGFFEQSTYATEVGERLAEVYSGGSIALLAGHSQGHRIMIPSGIPINRFRIVSERDSLELHSMPWERNRYFILSKDPDPEAEALASYWLDHFSLLSTHYMVVSENPEYLLLERKEDRLIRTASANVVP
ncbi:phospholipid carrier-dependent glycosyltransferase [bacterium]|nr:MAG: phospholipid carrier-dependent glycosyltransferase [bacterium]